MPGVCIVRVLVAIRQCFYVFLQRLLLSDSVSSQVLALFFWNLWAKKEKYTIEKY